MYESGEDEDKPDDQTAGKEVGDEEPVAKEVGDGELFDPNTEQKEVASLSLVALKSDVSKTAQSPGKLDIMNNQLQLPILPDFTIEGNKYILLSDIQKVFSIWEDYALGAIAKMAEQNDGFESDDSQELLELEENFNPVECMTICFNRAREQREKSDFLTNKDFQAFQRQCGFDKLQDSTKDFIERDTTEGGNSIDLYKSDTFLYDETEEVSIPNRT